MRMILARFIIVGNYDHALMRAKPRRILFEPFSRTANVACRGQTNGAEVVGVLLTFHDEDGFRFDDFWQMIRNLANALHIPYPSAIPIGPALSEVFRREP